MQYSGVRRPGARGSGGGWLRCQRAVCVATAVVGGLLLYYAYVLRVLAGGSAMKLNQK